VCWTKLFYFVIFLCKNLLFLCAEHHYPIGNRETITITLLPISGQNHKCNLFFGYTCGVRLGAGAISSTFWWRRCTEQSRSYRWDTFLWPLVRDCPKKNKIATTRDNHNQAVFVIIFVVCMKTVPVTENKTQRFKSGFLIFWVLGFWFWVLVFRKSFANF